MWTLYLCAESILQYTLIISVVTKPIYRLLVRWRCTSLGESTCPHSGGGWIAGGPRGDHMHFLLQFVSNSNTDW